MSTISRLVLLVLALAQVQPAEPTSNDRTIDQMTGVWYLRGVEATGAVRTDVDLVLHITADARRLWVETAASLYGVPQPTLRAEYALDGGATLAPQQSGEVESLTRRLVMPRDATGTIELITDGSPLPGDTTPRARQRERWEVSDARLLTVVREDHADGATSTARYTFARQPRPASPKTLNAANDFRASLAAQAAYLRLIGQAMPERSYHEAPVKGVRTFAEQLLYIANGLVGITGALTGDTTFIDPDATGKSKADVLRVVATAFDHAARIASAVPDQHLDDQVPWQSPMLERPTISKRQILATTRDHLAHHRGQIIVYLRLQGIEPPPYVGF